jgi:hypothetical protein
VETPRVHATRCLIGPQWSICHAGVCGFMVTPGHHFPQKTTGGTPTPVSDHSVVDWMQAAPTEAGHPPAELMPAGVYTRADWEAG